MALDNKFRVSELVQSGSRAIISEDPISKTHTFIDGSTTIVSQSASEPYEHIEGERDGELTNFIEKPKYEEEQLKKAVDTVIDELIVPPLPPSPPVVPKPVYDDLLERYNQAIADLATANNTIRDLQAQIAQLQGQIQSLRQQLDAALVARAIAENQLQQQASSFGDLSAKFSQAIIKATREASARVSLQAQVAGLDAQKETLREQILGLRQIVASLQGQVESQLAILDQRVAQAEQAQQQAQDQISEQQDTLAGKGAEIAAGAKDSGTKFTARVLNKGDTNASDIAYKATRGGFDKWLNGPEIKIYNYSDSSISITFSINDSKMLNMPSSVTIGSKESKNVKVIARETSVNGGRGSYDPNARISFSGEEDYKSSMQIKGGGESVAFGTELRKRK